MVDTIVDADWQIRRLRMVEAKLWDHVLASDDSGLGGAYARNLRLSTACTTAAKRSSARTTASLQQLRQLRQSSEDNLDFDQPPSPADGLPSELGSFSASLQPVEMPVLPGAGPREENKALRL